MKLEKYYLSKQMCETGWNWKSIKDFGGWGVNED